MNGAELTLQGLTFSYGRRLVLDGLTLHLSPGERVALLGRNGSGGGWRQSSPMRG